MRQTVALRLRRRWFRRTQRHLRSYRRGRIDGAEWLRRHDVANYAFAGARLFQFYNATFNGERIGS